MQLIRLDALHRTIVSPEESRNAIMFCYYQSLMTKMNSDGALLVPCRGRRSGIMYESSVPFLRAVRALYAPRHAALHRLMTSWPRNRGFHQPRPPLSTKRLDRQSFCYDCWALLCNQFQCFCLNDVYVRCVRVS